MGGFTIPETTVSSEQPSRGRPARVAKAFGRLFSREATWVVFVGFALSGLFNLPLVLHPKSMIANDLGDPLLQTWEMAWHRNLFATGDFWTANIFFPSTDNFAFTDSLLGYLPLALIGGDGQYDAVFRYNIAYVTAFALAFVGAYLLVKQLGGNWQAATVAGVVFAWAPWRLTHGSHLNILSTGGIALALYALAKGHGYSLRHGLKDEPKPWWILAGWLIAAWQITIGFATGIPFAYLMGVVGIAIVVTIIKRWRQVTAKLIVFNGVGVAIFLLVTLAMLIPYFRVVEQYGFTREWKEVQVFSPPLRGLWTAHYDTWLWLETGFNRLDLLPQDGVAEMMLFPGLAVTILAITGLFVSSWPVRTRIWLGVATLVMTILCLGASVLDGAYTYRPLWEHLPGFDAIRTPGRLVLWVILLLVVLAAGAVTRFGELMVDRTQVSLRLIPMFLFVPVLAVLLEGIPARTYVSPLGIPPDLQQVFAQGRDPMLILPIDEFTEYKYLLWSTDGFPKIANGTSGNYPQAYNDILAETQFFPDESSVAVLRKYGIRTVVLMKVDALKSPYAAALIHPLNGLPITKQELNDVVVFTIAAE